MNVPGALIEGLGVSVPMLALAVSSPPSRADTLKLEPSKDNTLYQEANGALAFAGNPSAP